MAGLALGVPIVTHDRPSHGVLLGRDWLRLARAIERAARMAAEALRLLSDDDARQRLAARGRDLYVRQFDVRHTIGALRRAAQEPCASPS